MIKHKKL